MIFKPDDQKKQKSTCEILDRLLYVRRILLEPSNRRFEFIFSQTVFLQLRISEAPRGYVSRRGRSTLADIDIDDRDKTLQECADICSKQLRNTCVGFMFGFRDTDTCYPKSRTEMLFESHQESNLDWRFFEKVKFQRPPSFIEGHFHMAYDIGATLEADSLEECFAFCKADPRCMMAEIENPDMCLLKHEFLNTNLIANVNYNGWVKSSYNDGPCLHSMRFRDICIWESVDVSMSPSEARQLCHSIGGNLLRPFGYRKWRYTNEANNWSGYYRLDLDSVGRTSDWRTSTGKVYPEQWHWGDGIVNNDCDQQYGPYADINASPVYRKNDMNYNGGLLTCEGGAASGSIGVMCEIREKIVNMFHNHFIF